MNFSVIVPVFNTEEYLSECIESVLSQTYHNFELILVNDGSSDNSESICEEYKEKYPDKIVTIHKKNEGPYVSRVCGINRAKGNIILFLDSDDCLRQDALWKIKEVFDNRTCDVVIYNASIDTKFEKTYKHCGLKIDKNDGSVSKNDIYKTLIESSQLNSLWNKAIKRDILTIDDNYHRFSGVKHGEDLLQLLPIFTYAKKIIYLNQNLYYYRQREGSLVHKFDIDRSQSIKKVHKELEKYIDLWGMHEFKRIHCAREVRGWIDSVELLLVNKKNVEEKVFVHTLEVLSDDEYFKNAYINMDKTKLRKRYLLLAKWLYNKSFFKIRLYGMLKRGWRFLAK